MASSDSYSQRPFVMGSLIGVRSFRVRQFDTGWRLTGPVFSEIAFEPGENVAVCGNARNSSPVMKAYRKAKLQYDDEMQTITGFRGTDSVDSARGLQAMGRRAIAGERESPVAVAQMDKMTKHLAQMLYGVNVDYLDADTSKPLPVEPVKPTEAEIEASMVAHRAGEMDCSCGFYAFLNPNYTAHDNIHTQVLGLIEGYGVATVGVRGFRAEKARLVALIGVAQKSNHLQANPAQAESDYRRRVPQSIVDTYQVPLFATFDQAVLEYPLTKPEPEED